MSDAGDSKRTCASRLPRLVVVAPEAVFPFPSAIVGDCIGFDAQRTPFLCPSSSLSFSDFHNKIMGQCKEESVRILRKNGETRALKKAVPCSCYFPSCEGPCLQCLPRRPLPVLLSRSREKCRRPRLQTPVRHQSWLALFL